MLVRVPNTFFSATGVCKLTVINWGKWCKKCVEPHSSTILSALIINELPLRCKPRGGNINFSTPSFLRVRRNNLWRAFYKKKIILMFHY